MEDKTLWTSKVTEEQARTEWENKRKRCSWTDIGSFEDNKEIAMDDARSQRIDELFWLGDDLGMEVIEEDKVEIFKEGKEKPIFGFKVSDLEIMDRYEVLFNCIEYVSAYDQDTTLKRKNGELVIEVDWEDWLTKEKGIDCYTIKINGETAKF